MWKERQAEKITDRTKIETKTADEEAQRYFLAFLSNPSINEIVLFMKRTGGKHVVFERIEVEVEDLRRLDVDGFVLQIETTVVTDVVHDHRTTAA